MRIVAQLVRTLGQRVLADARYPSELFSDYRYVFGAERCCHVRTIDLLFEVAQGLPGVASVDGNRALVWDKPRWKPDAVLWNKRAQPLCIVEYESINSSDARIVEKDFAGYQRWRAASGLAAPLLIITTLPVGETPHYRLLYTRHDQYNWEHPGKLDKARQDPFAFWYRYYRKNLKGHAAKLPLFFANFNGNRLDTVTL